MGTKNKPGDFDCYANAHPDEPMFVLLGRDRLAGALVRHWAYAKDDGTEPEKIEEARRCADAMDAWAKSTGKEPMPIASELRAQLAALTAQLEEAKAAQCSDTGELWIDECERARKQRDEARAVLVTAHAALVATRDYGLTKAGIVQNAHAIEMADGALAKLTKGET